MKNIASKKITQKIFLIVLIVLLLNGFVSNYSMAQHPSDRGTNSGSASKVVIDSEITEEDVKADGGTLLTPIKQLGYTLADAIMSIVQKIVIGNKYSYPVAFTTPATIEGDYWDDLGDNHINYPAYLFLTPESIFRNQIAALNPNFINPVNLDGTLEKALGNSNVIGDGTNTTHAQNVEKNLNTLRSTIAKWYVGIRNFSLVGLLSVLVYIGIRVVISSTASDKAKYKQMISSWVGAVCLIFLLHYIMAFTFTLTEKLTDLFNTNAGAQTIALPKICGKEGSFTFNNEDNNDKFSDILDALQEEGLANKSQIFDGTNIKGVANLMQYARLYANLNGSSGLGYTVVYIFLVGFTVWFLAKYIARFIRIAFLTLIAPLITLTYPIDKLNDGQAQAFNMWLKEFIFNILIQPFHLLIYMVFISSALDFANSNIIYTIVVLGFMAQAEKLLRKMFGFEKASTLGSFSGAAAGSMLANVAGKIGNKVARGKSGSGGNSGSGGSGNGDNQPDKIRAKEDPYEGLDSGNDNGNGQRQTGTAESDEQNKSAQQKMADSYDEGYGTEDYDPTERESIQRDLMNEQQPESMYTNMSDEDKVKDFMENLGVSEEEAREMLGISEADEAIQELPKNTSTEEEQNGDNLTRGDRFKLGAKALGRNIGRSVGNATGMHKIRGWKNMSRSERAKALGRQMWNGTKTMAPKALKLGTKYTLAGTAALAAGAAALMSGDPTKVASAAGIGLTAGSKLGGALSDKAVDRVSKISRDFMRGYHDKDYASKQEAALNDKWNHDPDVDNKYLEAFGNEKFKDAKEAALEMRENYGTTDDDQIIKSLKMTSEFGGEKAAKEATKANTEVPTLELAKRIPAFAKGISDDMYDDYDKYSTGRNKMIDKFTRQPGYDLKKAEQTTDTILKQVARVKGKEIPVQNKTTGKTNKK